MLIIAVGVFIRFYNLEKVYTEYDDIGVVSLHKSLASNERAVHLYKDGILGIDVTVNSKGLKENLLDSVWYPVYLGYTWTYPAGQYIIDSLVVSEKDSSSDKILKSRAISATFSALSIFILLYILYLLNDSKIDTNLLMPMALLSVSYNSVLYAHHASPYSLTVSVLLISLLLYIFYYKNKITETQFFVLQAMLLVFNYLVLILMPIYIVLIIIQDKNRSIMHIIKKIYKGILLFGVIFLPVFILFFKPSKGLHGSIPPSGLSFANLLYFPKQFVFAVSSTVQGLFVNDYLTIFIMTFVFLFAIYIYFQKYVNKRDLNEFVFIFIFFIIY